MKKELIGEKFGRITILSEKENRKALCLCSCGKKKIMRVNDLKRGKSKSCGCLRKEKMTTHGMKKTKEYSTWNSMKNRCLNKNNPRSFDYMGRGITICDKWLAFEGFYEDMGDRPKNKTLDRINNEKGYYKENCRWATDIEQQSNTRKNIFIEFDGEIKTASQWSISLGGDRSLVSLRIRRGWTKKRAVSTFVKNSAK